MFKPYLKSIVRNGGKGRMGLGIELFRLDAVAQEDLTTEEAEAAEESKGEATGTAIMRIYEEIGEDFWTGGGVTAKRFADELDSFGDIKQLNIHINSLGGDVFTAQAIYNIIGDHSSNKTAYIDGVAASAATIVACAADEVIARHNTNYMIHFPWAVAVGNAETMRQAAEDLDKITVPIINVYKAQVKGKTKEPRIRSLMEEETWMTPDEALDYGFVDKVKGKIKAIAKVSKSQIMCSGRVMDIAKYHYHNVPEYPMMVKAKAESSPEVKIENEPQIKETKKMTNVREEIDPTLLASIETKAKEDERVRLAALDAMDGPGLSDVIAKAKKEGLQPNDIAMECYTITKGQLVTATATSALARDAKPANNVTAGDAPSRKSEDPQKARVNSLIMGAFKAQRPKAMANANNGN